MSGGVEHHVERELKLGMTEAQWRDVRQALGTPARVLEQTNTYFDTPDRYLRAARGMMVRIRQEDERFEVTAKDRILGEASGRLETRERTQALSPEVAARALSGAVALTSLEEELCRSLAASVPGPLGPIGAVKNTREVYALGGGYLAEVDRTEFVGHRVDFEVEIELREPQHSFEGAKAALEAATGIDCSDLTPSRSKYGRFLSLKAS